MTRDQDTLRMLAEVEAANADLAERAKAPVWYHPALGLLIGALIAVQGQPTPILAAVYAACIAGMVVLVRAYKRHTGLWIGGYRAGRTRWVALGLATLTMIGGVIAVWLLRERGLTAAPLIFGAIVAVIVTIGGFVWEAAFRADLRDGRPL
ncbi:hypothetical protein EIB18_17925 [Caulobacter vibrioides]|uniref:hypothetical protein n=1 Tax=Caulobacter vibrioides TaxID=155892 RepID=UPI000BB45CEB|nr:hypothetical protein [Caulobacter vibrioides]ATC26256.1 hypothetical protein CA608_17810 [Caulobacter vibrioides]AZH14398.1 hypothetical protein EIB18_17925 [Caulobacter vibrioides]PLR10888.1 hypothetical protein CVUC_12465 [Caulobacter vibrioides]